MRLLINKFFSKKFFLLLRNTLKIKPVRISKYYLDKNISMSDAFLFRTDKDFCSVLRFVDIPNLFFNSEDSNIEIQFYDFQNQLIKKEIINPKKNNNELLIDKNYLNGKETYGHFFIFHNVKNVENRKISFSNRCYVGFSKKKNNFSFVHGNTYVKAKNLNDGSINSDFVNISLIKNYKYIIQENFSEVDYLELIICNPTSHKLKISINGVEDNLERNCDKLFRLSKTNKIEIISNCTNLRPIVFTYKNEFYDVHHG